MRFTLLTVTLDIREDGTYQLEDSGLTSSGEVRWSGDRAELVPKMILERRAPSDAPRPRLRRLSPTVLELIPAGGLFAEPVQLQRLAQPSPPVGRSSR